MAGGDEGNGWDEESGLNSGSWGPDSAGADGGDNEEADSRTSEDDAIAAVGCEDDVMMRGEG